MIRRGSWTQLVDSSGTTSYNYDDLYRLTEVDYPNSDVVSYGYDAVGNRTSLTVNGTTTTNTFDAANELTASGSDTYSYDDNGNLTSKTVSSVTTAYGYDALNQLTSISGPVSASYVYNGDGLRVSKTVSSTTTNYTWDQTGIGQVISDGNDYVWGLGLISQITSGTPTYAHSDGLGDTRLLTDSSGSVVGTQEYDAFGVTRSQSGTQLPFTYTGEQVDPESGLVYLRNRYLDPATGRFMTPDPLSFLGSGVNLYAYVGGDPINSIDPSGAFSIKETLHTALHIAGSPLVQLAADTIATVANGGAAIVTDVSAGVGCAAFGAAGCALGYGAGRVEAASLTFVATGASLVSAISGCFEHTRSGLFNCVQGFLIYEPLKNIGEPNIAFGLSLAAVETDYGEWRKQKSETHSHSGITTPASSGSYSGGSVASSTGCVAGGGKR